MANVVRKYKDLQMYSKRFIVKLSSIFIMADHGYKDGMHDKVGEMLQNPIFFVKGIIENHDFRVSQAPVSFEDLQNAYRCLLSRINSGEIFEWEKGDSRKRRFLVYQFR